MDHTKCRCLHDNSSGLRIFITRQTRLLVARRDCPFPCYVLACFPEPLQEMVPYHVPLVAFDDGRRSSIIPSLPSSAFHHSRFESSAE